MFLLGEQEDEANRYYLDEKKEREGEKKRFDLCVIHFYNKH